VRFKTQGKNTDQWLSLVPTPARQARK
jgi:hypothetical protein